MKKMMWLGVLLVGAIGMASAQESRMDASANFIGTYSPAVYGLGVEPMTSTHTGGFLGSFRYLLTPRSGLELNYSWAQYSVKYNLATALIPNSSEVHARQQEISGAYVYSRSYRNYNPFVEAGVGGMIFTPILDNGRTPTWVGSLAPASLMRFRPASMCALSTEVLSAKLRILASPALRAIATI